MTHRKKNSKSIGEEIQANLSISGPRQIGLNPPERRSRSFHSQYVALHLDESNGQGVDLLSLPRHPKLTCSNNVPNEHTQARLSLFEEIECL